MTVTPSDDTIESDDSEAIAAPKRRFLNRRTAPLLPEAGAAGAPLTAVIAVMSFLAVLAMASLLMVNRAASEWTSALRSEITVQVKGASADEISTGVADVMRILNQTEGVLSATERSREETAKLLEPWLGQGNAQAFINIPAIIEVKASPELRKNLDLLRNQIAAAAPEASLDDHARWHDRLAGAARSGQSMALGVFLLVMSAACAISIFAARAGLAANHEIVSVLHLVGATDSFIAAEVQQRFFVLGLRGALIGLGAALAALMLAGVAMRSSGAEEAFLPAFRLGGWMALWLVTAPIATCLVTAVTARLTVLRTLREQY
ncbi:cell division protein FtsX [Hyphococcus sp.]|uniref:cell division protein FtsX n=1 Tax=Hyphococcus sp. TaxID=2038636 RepID=UPI002088773D|nr:MAG: cell division protein FtsX [Marinicaulis sp.]